MSQAQYYSRYTYFNSVYPIHDLKVSMEKYHEWLIDKGFYIKGDV